MAGQAKCAGLGGRKELPDAAAEETFGGQAQHAGTLFIQVGEAPFPVDDAEAVGHAGENGFKRCGDAAGALDGAGEGFLYFFALGDVPHVDGETFVGRVVVVLQPLVDGIAHILFEVNGLAAVSYTHLDVYKRQTQRGRT